MKKDLSRIPDDLPVPIDDGACDHLAGSAVPGVTLMSTLGERLHLTELATEPLVLFFYPRTGRPEEPKPDGWDAIPGARGCTPQSCSFRDAHSEFVSHGWRVLGVSTQTTEYQQEFVERNHLPFPLLSDAELELTRAWRLPTFEFPVRSGGPNTLIRRMSLAAEGGVVRRVWYPVFPPNENASAVLDWIAGRGGESA